MDIKIRKDKITPTKDKEANQQIRPIVADVDSRAVPAPSNNLLLPTSNVPQTKIDAMDRRQIEAENEDKSHTTKETLDDIKRIHYKEKKKKEQNDIEKNQTGTYSEGRVSKNQFECINQSDFNHEQIN